jgi:hypothetical protein
MSACVRKGSLRQRKGTNANFSEKPAFDEVDLFLSHGIFGSAEILDIDLYALLGSSDRASTPARRDIPPHARTP